MMYPTNKRNQHTSYVSLTIDVRQLQNLKSALAFPPLIKA